jgi:hypothetical protein
MAMKQWGLGLRNHWFLIHKVILLNQLTDYVSDGEEDPLAFESWGGLSFVARTCVQVDLFKESV